MTRSSVRAPLKGLTMVRSDVPRASEGRTTVQRGVRVSWEWLVEVRSGGRVYRALVLLVVCLTAFVIVAAPGTVRADETEAAGATPLVVATPDGWESPVEKIEIQRVKPEQPKKPTLRFLHENLEFLRSRLDPLREVRELESHKVRELDPALLEYLALGRSLTADTQSRSAMAANGLDRDALMASVRAIADLEDELDRISALLDSSAVRVGILEDDFVGRQETTLLCLVRGADAPGAGGTSGFGGEGSASPRPSKNIGGSALPDQITLRSEDGRVAAIVLDDPDARILRDGGMLQVWHDFLEPRTQTLQLALGSKTTGTEVGYLRFEPVRDRLNVLEIDLTPGAGLDAAQASLWSHPQNPSEATLW
ncbi:MAG: hypothetical protein R3E12_10685 [Candidatus Eisenbacteria bacterium]|uniref:Uncharacterized protein n=1 Tax=Eiseniibacteriota bacterium TaxID=2212470 RepID=A0A956M3R6_UNCEI|nr:hypothetical protein [Candidatus Eisenbacteria bacterium]